jgi:sulfur-oxidizing protein SoxB
VIGRTDSLLYRRGNFNGTWDDLICQGIMEERDTQIALSPGFRWGTTLLPGSDITIDDLYSETSMSYPSSTGWSSPARSSRTSWKMSVTTCSTRIRSCSRAATWSAWAASAMPARPTNQMGSRISDMRLTGTGEPLEADKTYTVGGWASVNEGVEGPAIYDLMENYITKKKVVSLDPMRRQSR